MPDDNRLLIFMLMLLMTVCHVLMKVLACSFLLRVNQLWFKLYLAGDICVYLFYKIVRGELRYALRVDGVMSYILALSARIVVKTVTDFTLLVNFRHPFELGSYWLFNMILNQSFCVISVYLYD